MECNEASALIDAYIDGELAPERLAGVESHLRSCARCAALVDERRALRDAVAEGAEYRAAPPLVREAVVRGMSDRPIGRVRAPAWAWMSVAAAVVLAGATAWLAMRGAAGAAVEDIVLREAVSSHIRSLMASHLADIATSDQHTVKPWFAGKLDFAPRVVDFAADGFPLAGGRLDYVAGRPVAALVYNRRAHVINLFTCPDDTGKPGSERAAEDRGYHAISWSDGGMRFCAVSDVNAEELEAFVRKVRDAK